jgi:hypothetical protein
VSDVYIVGIDMIRFGRFPERTVPSLAAEAALLALDDAGLSIRDMQALFCGNLGQASGMVGQRMLAEIGQTGIPVTNVANACATGATAFRDAWMAVKAGVYDVVLAVGAEQMGKGLLGGAAGVSTEGLIGSGTMPAMFSTNTNTPQVRHHLRAVRQGLGEEPLPLDDECEVDVPEGDSARRGHGRGDDRLAEHEAHVFGERRRLGSGRARLGGEAASARACGPRRARARLADEQQPVRGAPTRDARLQCRDAPRGAECL